MIEHYINSSDDAERMTGSLLKLWTYDEAIDLQQSIRNLSTLANLSYSKLGNLKHPEMFIKHSRTVSTVSERFSRKIKENYPRVDVMHDKMAYLGIVEDFMRCLANEDGQPLHEILGFVYSQRKGYKDIAYGSQPHFVCPEILEELQGNDEFTDVSIEQNGNIYLDVVTATDALCTTEFLGDDGLTKGFKRRVKDIRARYRSDSPLIRGLENGGEARLEKLVGHMDRLYSGVYDEEEVLQIYSRCFYDRS